jgi:predicted ribosomally synthesized peptide with SipW-like signal peptide
VINRTIARCWRLLRSVRGRAILSLGMVLGLGTVSTLAYWTDNATLAGGTFTAGTLDIKLSGVDNNPAAFTTSFALANMQPGDAKAASVTVQNAGSLDFTYTATGIAPGALGSQLVFRVVPGGTVAGSGTSMSCSGGTQTFNATMNASQAVIPTDRPIASAGSESFCVTATLPSSSTTGQGTSTTATFTFNAKQVGAP